MPAVFVHVSDIHFGQERDHEIHVHNDVKSELIADASRVVASLPTRVAHGILVTGDIAHSGQRAQYEQAAEWLDGLAEAIGCPRFQVQMVPGNHDLDRSKLSIGGDGVLRYLRDGGAAEYEKIIGNAQDRATLMARFEDYCRFSDGYSCSLDQEAKFATNLRIEIAPGRFIRFIRFNSSLLCTGEEKIDPPELVIGTRQLVIPRLVGEENVVLVHHPLKWYKDSTDVSTYLHSRARVFISGHEHNPRVEIKNVDDDEDLLMLAAGAAVPFRSNDVYTYTYNVIEFDWHEERDALVVTIHPRTWNPKKTKFEADEKRLGGKEPQFILGSPNFRGASRPAAATAPKDAEAFLPVAEAVPVADDAEETAPVNTTPEGYELTKLRFFRDLLEGERLKILVDLDAVDGDSDERLTQGLERRLFEHIVQAGRIRELTDLIEKNISERTRG